MTTDRSRAPQHFLSCMSGPILAKTLIFSNFVCEKAWPLYVVLEPSLSTIVVSPHSQRTSARAVVRRPPHLPLFTRCGSDVGENACPLVAPRPLCLLLVVPFFAARVGSHRLPPALPLASCRYIHPSPALAALLGEARSSGKRLFLLTNSAVRATEFGLAPLAAAATTC